MKKVIWCFTFLIPFYTWAQISIKDLEFDNDAIDFGNIILEDGPVEAVYKVVNKGDSTFIVSGLDAACGCTSPNISKKSLKPGDSAVISAWFDPKGMVGTVSKWVYLQGNFNDAPHKKLTFKANIKSNRIPPHTEEQNYYPGQYGYLMLYSYSLLLGEHTQGYTATHNIDIFNDGTTEYSVLSVDNLPPFIKAVNLPLIVAPKEKKSLELQINTALIDTVGPLYGTFTLLTNDAFFTKKSLQYSIDLKKDFSKLKRRERKRAPAISFDKIIIDMGQMNSGQLLSKTIQITNEGKNDLLIYRIDTDCTCAMLKNPPRQISPGQSVQAEIQFDALFKSGKQNKGIILYTNDPVNPIVTLSVRANVK